MLRASSSLRCSFQFTHPVRGATVLSETSHLTIEVSIHAPRAGCDDIIGKHKQDTDKFQFTHPVRGATESICSFCN